jgi:3-deoxy-manno-octulosonate cytidylyltransferase (CMP-KDO synthetase)
MPAADHPGPVTTVAIPARLESTRLPRKVLADVGGQTLLRRTYEVAVAAGCGPVVVLTDAQEVVDEVRSFGGEAWLTDPRLASGTARIAAVAERIESAVVVNLQADAPLTDPAVVRRAAREASAGDAAVTMPVYRLVRPEDVHDPNVVKVVRARDGAVLYCSRSAIPHVRGAEPQVWPETTAFWGHVGLYAYTLEFLRRFEEMPASLLEEAERLEQLRWLEAGFRLQTFEVDPQGPSVDTPAQLEEVRSMITQGGIR